LYHVWDDTLSERDSTYPLKARPDANQGGEGNDKYWGVTPVEGVDSHIAAGYLQDEGEILIQVLRTQDYSYAVEPDKHYATRYWTRLSHVTEIPVPEPGRYIVRCWATFQVSNITELIPTGVKANRPIEEVPQASLLGTCGRDGRGQYEIEKAELCTAIKGFGGGGYYVWKYYKRYTYLVMGETVTYVFPGSKEDQALVILPNDPDTLGQLAVQSGNNQIELRSVDSDEMDRAIARDMLSEAIGMVLFGAPTGDVGLKELGEAVVSAVVSGETANIIMMGAPSEAFLSSVGETAIEFGATAIVKVVLVKVAGVGTGPAGWAAMAVVMAVKHAPGIIKWNTLLTAYHNASVDDWLKEKLFLEQRQAGLKYYDIFVQNYGTPAYDVYLGSSGPNTSYDDKEYGIVARCGPDDIGSFRDVPDVWFRNTANDTEGYVTFTTDRICLAGCGFSGLVLAGVGGREWDVGCGVCR